MQKQQKMKTDRRTLKWLYGVSKKQMPAIVFLAFSNTFTAAFSVFSALLFRELIDNAIGGRKEKAIMYMVIVASLAAFSLILSFFVGYVSESAKAKVEIAIRVRIMNVFFSKDYLHVSAQHTGEILNKITNDTAVISDGIVNLVPNTLGLISGLTFAFFALLYVRKVFAIIFLAGGILLFLVMRFFRRLIKGLHKVSQETEGKSRALMQESLESDLVIRVFGAQKQINKKIKDAHQKNYRARMKLVLAKQFSSLGFGTAFRFGYYFTFFWCVFMLIERSITYGTLTAMLQLVNRIQSPVSGLSSLVPWYFSIVASAERILEIEDIPDEDEDAVPDDSVSVDKFRAIRLENVTFAYADEAVIKDADLTVNRGDTVAVTGISGIGKSTIMKLMLSVLKAEKGRVELVLEDKTVPVSKYTRHLFSYVPQGNMLMSGTILENITFFKKADEESIDRALKTACAYDFINELPEGINTVIGERGYGLSEGQIQRIAIARAMLNDAPVLLLDEATSALDEQTEKQLLLNLQAQQDKTCIIITHKKAALEVCNREVRIENKTIISN
ncbi:MAG: ABC transporter ATP-binding protein/permease [Clostridiales bacterium]|nr:ABC transporter ATP-binding protein/permease [Clostridiales bacterium]